MTDVVTFGELMLKLSPPGYSRFLQANSFNVEFSGAEANVAVSLANFGCNVDFITVLPDNEIGTSAINAIRKYGVSTSHIARTGNRIGIYFAEKGASQRPSKVIYDRKHSAISEANHSLYDWNEIFKGIEWFHFTGITPALSDETALACIEACRKARELGIVISCDLNFRSKLWTKEKANHVMSELCKYVDVCIANESDASDVFGIKSNPDDIDDSAYFEIAEQLQKKFGFRKVFITLREAINASINNWSAILLDGSNHFKSRKYSINVVDRIGGGDSFGAGVIYACLKGYDNQHILDFAVAASCLKHSIEGDFNITSVDEVEALVNGNGSGRIQR